MGHAGLRWVSKCLSTGRKRFATIRQVMQQLQQTPLHAGVGRSALTGFANQTRWMPGASESSAPHVLVMFIGAHPSATMGCAIRPPLPPVAAMGQTACKPGSVPAGAGDGHSSGTPVTGRLARPTRTATRKPARRHIRPKAAGRHTVPTWSCSRWGLPCRPRCRERGALLPHPFALAGRREVPAGGLLSVALSLGSPPPGVTRHRASVEPGLSSPAGYDEGGHPAVWHS